MIAQSAPPRFRSVPEAASYDLGDQAVELAAEAGLELDEWQADVLRSSLGVRDDGKWAAFEVGTIVSRQNGKGGILEARELAGLFLLGEQMLIHSAHQFDTSLEAFRRLLWLMEDNPRFEDEIKRVSRAHGEEGIELVSGQRIRFRTRTKGGGRGFSGDWLGLDEAMFLPEYGYGALLPILSARPNPQVWYTGSAVDKDVHKDGIVFARVRKRGLAGDDPRLAFFEWSLGIDPPEGKDEWDIAPENVSDEAFTDEEAWAQANPALGVRISAEHIAAEQRALDARTFAVERLGVGDWPDPDTAAHVIDLNLWAEFVDLKSRPGSPVCFTFDVTPDRRRAAITKACLREDGLSHIEVVRSDAGTSWVVERLKGELAEHDGCLAALCDERGPAASLLPDLEDLDIEVDTINASEMARACGRFYDAVVERRSVRHLGTPDLTSALKGAVKRPLGDAWTWSRKNSAVDISPLVGVTLALWGLETRDKRSKKPLVAFT